MKIGSHVGNSGTKMLIGSVEEAISYGANALMVYLGAPQNTFRKPIASQNAKEAIELAKNNGIDPFDIIVHAPYIVNLAQMDDEKFNFAVRFISEELRGVQLIGAKILVLHPGAHVGAGSEKGIERIASGINKILENTKDCSSVIAIETMAGKGTECGRTFDEVASIIDKINDKTRIGVCLDTCHIHDGGYDLVNKYEEVLEEFDKVIGFNYLKVIHVNDSKNIRDSHKDRHENIGFGNIGFETIYKICTDPRFERIPKILETPYVDTNDNLSYPPYKHEIAMIRSGIFDNQLIEKIKSQM